MLINIGPQCMKLVFKNQVTLWFTKISRIRKWAFFSCQRVRFLGFPAQHSSFIFVRTFYPVALIFPNKNDETMLRDQAWKKILYWVWPLVGRQPAGWTRSAPTQQHSTKSVVGTTEIDIDVCGMSIKPSYSIYMYVLVWSIVRIHILLQR